MSNGPFHIVVIDDELAIEMLFKAFFDEELNSNKIKLTYCNEASTCIELLKEVSDVDLILTDINMPEMNGFEFLSQVKDVAPSVPIIMISAYGSPEYVAKAKSLGASEFFVKPFDFQVIKEKVEEYAQLKS